MYKLLSFARDYSDRFGWSIVGVRGKTPSSNWRRFITQRPSHKQMSGMFNRGASGLAVVLGAVSGGLRVRDFDRVESYVAWAASQPELACSLPTVRTSRGYHVYFRADLPDTVTPFVDGELRAGKGIVLLPPSKHPDGGEYAWVIPPGNTIPFIQDPHRAGLYGAVLTAARGGTEIPPEVAEAIARTLPTDVGQRNRQLWRFARRLKAIPGLDTSPEALETYVEEWHRRALPAIKTKDFQWTELDFESAWSNARTPLSDVEFESFVAETLAGPEPDWYGKWFFPPAGKRLLRICEALQTRAGNQPFFLAARTAAKVIGVDPTLICRMLKRLCQLKLLELVERGANSTRKASTWRYLGGEAGVQSDPGYATSQVTTNPSSSAA